MSEVRGRLIVYFGRETWSGFPAVALPTQGQNSLDVFEKELVSIFKELSPMVPGGLDIKARPYEGDWQFKRVYIVTGDFSLQDAMSIVSDAKNRAAIYNHVRVAYTHS